ncbi:MAG: PmoA family protein [Phycisphaerae bacterium]|nr:PmoA family protein [Phycisphaerae bacterium]
MKRHTHILCVFAATAMTVAIAFIACGKSTSKDAMTVRRADNDQHLEILDGDKCVLRYNFRNVPVPKTAKGKYAVARSDYIHPLYGPGGEVLTKDYSPEHPHHRGLYWAWPEVFYKSQKRDLHALQGVFARPDKIVRATGGKETATIAATSKWLWDKEEIVAETATITARRISGDGLRIIDLKFEFNALVEGVSIARRGQKAYGGFNMRFSARKDQEIPKYIDPVGKKPRRVWAQIVGVPPKGKSPVAVAIFQHAANPHYPGDWVTYPNLNWLQPTFPSKGVKYALTKGKPLVLRFRLCIRNGKMTDKQLAEQWTDFNRPLRSRT